MKDCIIPTVHGTVQTVGCAVWRKNRCANPNLEQGVEATEDNTQEEKKLEAGGDAETSTNNRSIRGTIMSALSLEKFESKYISIK
jgi:hypothetical protein